VGATVTLGTTHSSSTGSALMTLFISNLCFQLGLITIDVDITYRPSVDCRKIQEDSIRWSTVWLLSRVNFKRAGLPYHWLAGPDVGMMSELDEAWR